MAHTSTVRAALVCVVLVLVAGSGTAEAKRYSADRFDSRIEVLTDGSLRVTETIVFRFESGTFREVFRQLPARRTDGIEVERAAMDGQPFPRGSGPGQVEVSGGSRVRVTWRFEPTADTTHAFELVYLVRGAVRREESSDQLLWRVIPGDRRYPVASSTIDILLPAVPVGTPTTAGRRVSHAAVSVEGTHVRVEAEAIRSNGRLDVDVRLPRGSVLDGPPAWQARAIRHAELAPQWLSGAGAAFVLALIAIFAIRQSYDAPKVDHTLAATGPSLPDGLSPAEAGALVANGGARLEHAMGTIVALAERGEVTIAEEPRGALGSRHYRITRRPARRPAVAYEEALLEAIFTDKGRAEASVRLDKARTRVYRGFKRFRTSIEAELRGHRLFDDERARVRRRFARLGAALLVAAAILPIPMILLLQEAFGFWPLLVPAGLALGGVAALIAHAAHTPLSNEGLRRARYWRGFRQYLAEVTASEAAPPADSLDRLLPYAIALGLGGRWSKYLKDRRIEAPPWFHAALPGEQNAAFIAFIATSGTVATGGAGGGYSAAGGGGASGAR